MEYYKLTPLETSKVNTIVLSSDERTDLEVLAGEISEQRIEDYSIEQISEEEALRLKK